MAEFYAANGDIEASGIAYLQPLFAAALVTVRRPYGTDWLQPPTQPIIRLQVIDGEEPRALVLDPWRLAVEVWQSDSAAAAQLAGQVAGRLNAWQGRHAGVLIYDCRATRPRSAPDPLTKNPRYLITAAGTARLLGV